MVSIPLIMRERFPMTLLTDLVKEDFGITGYGRWWRSEVHSSLVVDSEKDVFYFNSRGLRGGALEYLLEVRQLPKRFAEEILKVSSNYVGVVRETGLQAKFEKLVNLFHLAGKGFRDYWYSYLLTDSTIDRYRLGHYDGWNLIPIYNGSKFTNFQCRKSNPKKIYFWYKDSDFSPILFNRDVLKFVTTAYITEGMLDCILLNQLGFPTVCSTNGAMSWNSGWIRYFSNITEIFYIADNDSAGVVSAKSVAQSLGSGRVKVLRFKDSAPKYGAADFFKDGHSVENFKEVLAKMSVPGYERSLL